MTNLAEFHDGSFEGVWSPTERQAHLFLKTTKGERFCVVLEKVIRLRVSNFLEGNQILEVVVRNYETLTLDDIGAVYGIKPDPSTEPRKQLLLLRAHQDENFLLEIKLSCGASCIGLAQAVTLMPRAEWVERFGR